MNKIEEISQRFLLLKTKLNQSDISFLCHHSFRSITGGIKGLYKESLSPNNTNKNNQNNEKEQKADINNHNIKSNLKSNNNDYLKNLLISLESSNKKVKTEKNNKNKNIINTDIKNKEEKKSNLKTKKEKVDSSPTILNDDENLINTNNEVENKPSTNNLISLNEDDEEKSNKTNNNLNNLQKQANSNTKRRKVDKKISINIIDKDNKNLNIKEKIIENFSEFSSQIRALVKIFEKISPIETFYNEQKEKIMSLELNYDTIYFGTFRNIIYLMFNTLSKIFTFLLKETENDCYKYLSNIFDIINLNIRFTKIIKKFIHNNSDNCDLSFFKNIKIVGNYCYTVLFLKKNNYEYIHTIQIKKDSEQINKFVNNYMKYLKSINKLRHIFKDNNLFNKHFMIQPTMVSLIELYEMNKRIINYQLNDKYSI